MGTRPTELGVHRVSLVPRIASEATMGQHASTVAHEQDTSVECSLGVLPSQVDRAQKQTHKPVFVDAPSAAANWAEESWALGSGLLPPMWGESPVGRVIDMAPWGQNGAQRLLGGPKPSSRLGQRAQRSTVQCPSARRFQTRLSCFDFSFSPVAFFSSVLSWPSRVPFLYKRTLLSIASFRIFLAA